MSKTLLQQILIPISIVFLLITSASAMVSFTLGDLLDQKKKETLESIQPSTSREERIANTITFLSAHFARKACKYGYGILYRSGYIKSLLSKVSEQPESLESPTNKNLDDITKRISDEVFRHGYAIWKRSSFLRNLFYPTND